MISNAKRWSAEEDKTITDLRADGETIAEIGRVLNRSPNSVASRLEALQRPVKPGAKTRPCMCCRTPFKSAGPQNRLCLTCRRIDVSPYYIC